MIRRPAKPAPGMAPAHPIDWERLADEFAVAYEETGSLPEALKRIVNIAKFGGAYVAQDFIDRVCAGTAARHGITVEQLYTVSGPHARKYAKARHEAFWLLSKRGMGWSAIKRVFRVHHTTVMAGVAAFEGLVAASSERAVDGGEAAPVAVARAA
jgi:hypothetical protein